MLLDSNSFILAAALLTVGLAGTVSAADSWGSVAGRFGCDRKVQEREQANGTQLLMEFLPKDQKLGQQERLFTVTLARLPQEEAEANEHAEAAIRSMANAVSRAGAKIQEFNKYTTNHGPVAFFEYVLKGEHNMGVVSRTGPGILTVYQLATFNEKSPTAEDRQRLRELIGLKQAPPRE
jgi:hypothetical protein